MSDEREKLIQAAIDAGRDEPLGYDGVKCSECGEPTASVTRRLGGGIICPNCQFPPISPPGADELVTEKEVGLIKLLALVDPPDPEEIARIREGVLRASAPAASGTEMPERVKAVITEAELSLYDGPLGDLYSTIRWLAEDRQRLADRLQEITRLNKVAGTANAELREYIRQKCAENDRLSALVNGFEADELTLTARYEVALNTISSLRERLARERETCARIVEAEGGNHWMGSSEHSALTNAAARLRARSHPTAGEG